MFDQQEMRDRAMDWLGRREYSRFEIAARLRRRFGAKSTRRSTATSAASTEPTTVEDEEQAGALLEDAIVQTIAWLAERHYVDDKRCAVLYVRSHIARGHGPIRIRQELIFRRGLAQQLVDAQIQESECDWFALAAETLQKRFHAPPDSLKEKARQLRFLQARGFTTEQCYAALDGIGSF